jgi:pimeloyl-ACP methyl ester carboxylesterase
MSLATPPDASTSRLSRRRLLASAATSAALAAGRPTFVAARRPAGSRAANEVVGLVDIGGRSLYLDCRGRGGPTVVLEAGYRSPATVWTDDLLQPESPREMVLPALAAETRVCAYERPGVAALLEGGLHPSRSDPVPMPRPAESVVADLHALLTAAGVPGPYVLVGHSLGGLFVRLFASTYPDEVAGLVLVDAWSEGLEELLTPEQWTAYVALNSAVPPELAAYPDLETIDFAAASATMRRAAEATPLGQVPLAVVSKGRPFEIPAEVLGFAPEALDRAWAAAQGELAALRPNARHVVATASSHYVQLEQPELVGEAVLAVVAAVRDPSTWPM